LKTLNEIGLLAIVSRMRRLCENIHKSVKQAYTLYDFEFDPRWGVITYMLSVNGQNTIMEISEATGMAHPNVIQLLKELEKAGWVISTPSPSDKRARLMSLSERAKEQLPTLEAIWSDLRRVLASIIDEGKTDFWAGLLEFEASLEDKSIEQRLMEAKTNDSNSSQNLWLPGKWFERKFNFKDLSTTPQGIIERLSTTDLRLTQRIKNLSENKLARSVDGKWSIKQNIGHLIDLEPLWLKRMHEIFDGKPVLTEADLTNNKTNEAGYNSLNVEDIISVFSDQRNKLINFSLQHFDKLLGKGSQHLRLGVEMRGIDLLYFVAEHDDHHLATINHLINA